MLEGIGDWFAGFDVWDFFCSIGNFFVWVLGKIVDLFFGVQSFIADALGGGSVADLASWILIIFVVCSTLIILFTRWINSTQGGIEGFSHSTMGLFLKIVAIIVVAILIMFILPNIEI